jgi:formate dehydrogenase subunit delta
MFRCNTFKKQPRSSSNFQEDSMQADAHHPQYSHKLARMANQIGSFFDAQPDQDAAARAVTSHLKLFWAPVMRKELIDSLDRGDDLGLRQVVIDAIKEHREVLLNTNKHLSGESKQFGPRGGGDAG